MQSRYLTYPEAVEKLEKGDLAPRFKRLKRQHEKFEDGVPDVTGFFSDRDLRDQVIFLRERGYFNTPDKTALRQIDGLFKDIHSFNWQVDKLQGAQKVKVEIEDIRLMVGDIAAAILSPEETWNPETFGFPDRTTFVSTVSAYIVEHILSSLDKTWRKGYSWKTILPNTQKFQSIIGGCVHSDMQIIREDVTSYPTIDPLGKNVLYRPMRESVQWVVSYHSVEADFLAILLKYVDEIGAKVDFLSTPKKRENFLKTLGVQPYFGGSCTEHLMGASAFARDAHFVCSMEFPQKMSRWGQQFAKHHVSRPYNEAAYPILIGPNNELVFCQSNKKPLPVADESLESEKVAMVIYPHEIGDMIKSLFYQCARGLGRTPASELVEVLNFRYSPEFEEIRKLQKEER